NKTELRTLLRAPSKGDASLILARQLVAAKLNIANGSDATPIQQTILDADAVLAPYTGRLPYSVPPSSAPGRMMTILAPALDVYNQGRLTRGCEGFHGDDEEGNHNGEHEDDGCLD